ncbi:hypothetical protein DU002_08520 [Corallincola holothuriorum]|uniref:Uncharacterized protein n=1 Tax=Corallincola holothuriorum TaxID=2282215 RepID=A0A368NIP2_9GAMM|nr:hypothetical protein DU002_08520 [Corallincola holothuriorum]
MVRSIPSLVAGRYLIQLVNRTLQHSVLLSGPGYMTPRADTLHLRKGKLLLLSEWRTHQATVEVE